MLEEAKYFGVESLVKLLEPTVELQNSHRDKAPLTSRDVVNALVTTDKGSELRFQGVNLAGADLSHLDLRNINFKVGMRKPLSVHSLPCNCYNFLLCTNFSTRV